MWRDRAEHGPCLEVRTHIHLDLSSSRAKLRVARPRRYEHPRLAMLASVVTRLLGKGTLPLWEECGFRGMQGSLATSCPSTSLNPRSDPFSYLDSSRDSGFRLSDVIGHSLDFFGSR